MLLLWLWLRWFVAVANSSCPPLGGRGGGRANETHVGDTQSLHFCGSIPLSFFLSFFPFFLSSENENEWFKFVVLSVILRFFVSIVFTPLYIKKITWTCGRVPLCLSLLFRVDKASLTFFNFFFVCFVFLSTLSRCLAVVYCASMYTLVWTRTLLFFFLLIARASLLSCAGGGNIRVARSGYII